MNFEIDDTLDDRMLALMEKQKKVKESQSMEKLMAPSNSLRSLYSDILSVKVGICRIYIDSMQCFTVRRFYLS